LNNLIAKETGHTHIPVGLAELDEKPIRFTEVIEGTTPAIEAAVEGFIA
jgi:threonine synthase